MRTFIIITALLVAGFGFSGCSPKALLSNSDIAFLNDLNRKVDELNATVVKQQKVIDEMQIVIIELEKKSDENEQ